MYCIYLGILYTNICICACICFYDSHVVYAQILLLLTNVLTSIIYGIYNSWKFHYTVTILSHILISLFCYIATIFYLTTRVTLNSGHFACRQAAQRSPLIQSALNTDPRSLAACEGNIKLIFTILKMLENFPFSYTSFRVLTERILK
jgi:hypothetical protein